MRIAILSYLQKGLYITIMGITFSAKVVLFSLAWPPEIFVVDQTRVVVSSPGKFVYFPEWLLHSLWVLVLCSLAWPQNTVVYQTLVVVPSPGRFIYSLFPELILHSPRVLVLSSRPWQRLRSGLQSKITATVRIQTPHKVREYKYVPEASYKKPVYENQIIGHVRVHGSHKDRNVKLRHENNGLFPKTFRFSFLIWN